MTSASLNKSDGILYKMTSLPTKRQTTLFLYNLGVLEITTGYSTAIRLLWNKGLGDTVMNTVGL